MLNVKYWFEEQTPDTSGVIFDWGQRGDTLWFLLQGRDGDIQYQDTFRNGFNVNLGVLDTGTYTMLFEGEKGVVDTFGLVVEDSLYRFVHPHPQSIYTPVKGKVVYFRDSEHDTLRRIFKDMLLVEAAPWSSDQYDLFDTLKAAIIETGATELYLSPGTYSMFTVNDGGVVAGVWRQDWFDAVNDGLMAGAVTMVFTYSEDTQKLESIFNDYSDKFFPALSIRMGNGFNRYFFAFGN